MSFVIGVALAIAVGLIATLSRLDRDRALYPVVMIVIAAYYPLFAVMGGSREALVIELALAALFIGLAFFGFRTSLWVVATALALHGLFDFVHPALYPNPGVPGWWPSFCFAYDVVAAAYLAWLLASRRLRAHPASDGMKGAA